jgi:hypothetical protein
MSMMNDNNDDDVDVGEVDGMGWGERGCVGKTQTRLESGGDGTAGCDWGEGADANRNLTARQPSFAMWPDRDS